MIVYDCRLIFMSDISQNANEGHVDGIMAGCCAQVIHQKALAHCISFIIHIHEL